MTAQQKDIGSGWGPTEPQSRRRYPAVPANPRQPTPRLLGQLLCDYDQSLWRSTKLEQKTHAGSTPAPYSGSQAPSDSPDSAVPA